MQTPKTTFDPLITTPIGDLKLCPFCGCPARFEARGDYIGCFNANCRVSPLIVRADSETQADIRDAWNTRSPIGHRLEAALAEQSGS